MLKMEKHVVRQIIAKFKCIAVFEFFKIETTLVSCK